MNYFLVALSILFVMISLTSSRILRVIEFLLSCITAFQLFKWISPKGFIYDPMTWDEHTYEWLNSGDAFYALLYLTGSYLFFYFFVRLIIFQLIEKRIGDFLKNTSIIKDVKFNRLIRAFIVVKYRVWIRRLISHGVVRFSGKSNKMSESDYNKQSYTLIIMLIHIICCWAVVSPYMDISLWKLIVFVVVFVVYLMFTLPILRAFGDDISKVIDHEEYLLEKNITNK